MPPCVVGPTSGSVASLAAGVPGDGEEVSVQFVDAGIGLGLPDLLQVSASLHQLEVLSNWGEGEGGRRGRERESHYIFHHNINFQPFVL